MSKSMAMSPVERAIYASTYSAALAKNLKDPPAWAFGAEKAAVWERSQAVSAIETAAYAVTRFREAAAEVVAGFDVDGIEVLPMYLEAREQMRHDHEV